MSFNVFAWNAPYETSKWAEEPITVRVPEPGALLVVQPYGDMADAASLETMVTRLRRRYPAFPVTLWIPDSPTEQIIELVRGATAAHVRAIVGGRAPDADQVRKQLTSTAGLGAFVIRWASDAGCLPADHAGAELRALLDAAPDIRSLARLAVERRVVARTLRHRLQQTGLPAPRAWLGLAHALHVAFFLQRNRNQSLQRAAHLLGYSDPTLMSHQFQRAFAMAPGAIRGFIGAEPLLWRWFGAHRRKRPAPRSTP